MAADVAGAQAEIESADTRLQTIASWLAAAPASAGTELGRGYQARTTLFRTPLGDVVVKSARGPWPWRSLGAAAIRREHRVYRMITGIPGIPQCLGLLENNRLVLEYLDGGTFRQREHEIDDWDRFFDRLLETIRAIHARGVAHGDLKRKDNLVVGADERPHIVDFGVASIERSSQWPWANASFRWMRQYDYNAWVKLKNRGQLEVLGEVDQKLYKPTRLEQFARVIRVVWQKLTLRRLRRRLWPRQP